MLSFKITVLIVIACIFVLFGFAAHKAESVMARKTKELLESQLAKNTASGKKK